MKRLVYTILSVLCLGIAVQAAPAGKSTWECGTWLELSATPFADYHFVEWSDGNTDSLRHVEVTGDAMYIAYFAANCTELPNLPVVALYDWLIMLNIKEIHQMGYYFNPTDVTWYRVVGEPDEPNGQVGDDEQVTTGYYLTLAQDLRGTGDYYAQIDIAITSSVELCSDVLRSVLVHYAGTEANPAIRLLPNATTLGGQMKLIGLNPEEETVVQIYSSAGQLMETFRTTGEPVYMLQAASVSGCYHVHVTSPTVDTVLKYVVYAK